LVKKSYKCNGILSRKNMDIQNSIGFLEKVKRFIEYDKNDTNYTSTTKKMSPLFLLELRVRVEQGDGGGWRWEPPKTVKEGGAGAVRIATGRVSVMVRGLGF
jgi:hypothetical protein